MKILLKLLTVLLMSLVVNSSSNEWCSPSKMDAQCGSYCYQVVKPLLDYASSIKTKEQQFEEMKNTIQQQEHTIKNLKETINLKQIQLTQQIEMSAEYKNSNAILKNQFIPYKAQISNLESVVKLKDTQINEQNEAFKKLQHQIKGKDDLLSVSNNKIKELELKCSNCREISEASSCLGKSTKLYTIQVPEFKTLAVPCDSDLAGAGWTVIQRRKDGSVNFYRKWAEYKMGFGNLRGEFFIGLENLRLLTQSQPHELYIHLEDFENKTRYARYSHFIIGNETELYEIKMLGEYSGNAGNSLKYHINMKFSTSDRDNDIAAVNCAESYKSGWWFTKCSYCDLNGPYTKEFTGMTQPRISWNGWQYNSLKSVQMMIRPKTY